MVQVSANEFIALPEIDEINGNINYITCLTMKHKGMLQIEGEPLIKPRIEIDNKEINLDNKLVWNRKSYWIPEANYVNNEVEIKIKYLTPKGHKAIALRIEITNRCLRTIKVGSSFLLNWVKTSHVVNECYEIESKIIEKSSNWNGGKTYQQFIGVPLIALADMENTSGNIKIMKNEKYVMDYYLGIGYEEVSAATAAKHLKRIGFDALYDSFVQYLNEKIIKIDDTYISRILNTNLLFSFFFSSGRTIDTEDLVLVTSRSPRYYVSAAYWDRDSLLWSFPAFLLIDVNFSKEVLMYIFTKQIKNIGEHSRFIDGTILEPGFELDELCAPIIALESYINKSGDSAILDNQYVKDGLGLILEKLKDKRHQSIHLYETFLMPTDDFTQEKYLTYNNVLVWKILIILSKYLQKEELKNEAAKVKESIYKYLVKDNMFLWSSDLNGKTSIYDEPPGSLLLLNYLGFCKKDSKIWTNTVEHIRSPKYRLSFANSPIKEIGCEHAQHPWILSLCNSLLSGFGKSAVENLRKMDMDNYIACESVYEDTGKCATGEAFATCAGFLAYSLDYYLNEK